MVILKSLKSRASLSLPLSPSLENTFSEKPQGGGQIETPQSF